MLAFSNQAPLASASVVFLNIAFVQEVGMHACVCICVCVCVCLSVCPCPCPCPYPCPMQTSLAIFFNCSELQLLK